MSYEPSHCELCAEEVGDLTKAWLCGPPHHWLLCGVCREAFWSGGRWSEKQRAAAPFTATDVQEQYKAWIDRHSPAAADSDKEKP